MQAKNTTAPIATSHIEVSTAGSDMRRLKSDQERFEYAALSTLYMITAVFFLFPPESNDE